MNEELNAELVALYDNAVEPVARLKRLCNKNVLKRYALVKQKYMIDPVVYERRMTQLTKQWYKYNGLLTNATLTLSNTPNPYRAEMSRFEPA